MRWRVGEQHQSVRRPGRRGGSAVSRPASIRDVAEMAGVSPALVSLALNNRAGVAVQTRARILAVAAELGYRANPVARSLRTGRSSMYGLLVRNLANPFFLDVISAAQRQAHAVGASLLVVDSDYSAESEREHVARLAAGQFDGLAIAPVGSSDALELWQRLRRGTPTVVLNADADGHDGVTRVAPDNIAAVSLAVEHLASLGHRHVAFLTAPRGLMADRDRLCAFEACASRLGFDPVVIETPLNLSAVEAAVGECLRAAERPTGIITNSDFTAHAVYQAARGADLLVGRDLSVVGHDDLPTSQLLDPPLTTLALDRRAMGEAVFARLSGAVGLGDHVQPVQLRVRRSTGLHGSG